MTKRQALIIVAIVIIGCLATYGVHCKAQQFEKSQERAETIVISQVKDNF